MFPLFQARATGFAWATKELMRLLPLEAMVGGQVAGREWVREAEGAELLRFRRAAQLLTTRPASLFPAVEEGVALNRARDRGVAVVVGRLQTQQVRTPKRQAMGRLLEQQEGPRSAAALVA